ncbi:MAG: DUF6020 family protein [Butyrivibrio sp.]|nr:DUF6020 family protein [Butyrivibrio sp.]
MSFETSDPDTWGLDWSGYISGQLYKLIEQTNEWIGENGFYITVTAALFFYVYYHFFVKTPFSKVKGDRLLSVFFAVMYAGGRAYEYADSIFVLVSPVYNVIKTFIVLIGMYSLYLFGIRALHELLMGKWNTKITFNKKISDIYNKHTFLIPWLIIIVCWFVHLFLRYPAALGADDWNEFGYYYGINKFTTAQPIFHTWVIGSFVEFGRTLLHSSNAGIFLCVICRMLIMSAVLAFTIYKMKYWSTPVWLRILTLCIYCFVPYYTGYVSFIVKDYMYIAGFVVWNILIIDLYKSDYLFKNKFWAILWLVASCFMCLFRKNGIYMYVFMTVLFMVLIAMKLFRSKNKSYFLTILFIVLPLIITSLTEAAITRAYNVEKDSPKEAFSLPFQQTARVVRDYGDELLQDEIDIIDKVLYFDELATTYDPSCSNDVKSMYHAASTEELMDYIVVWFKEFFRYPLCYIEATWNQNYYIFMPDRTNIVYNLNLNQGAALFDDNPEFMEFIGLDLPRWVVRVSITAVSFYEMLNRLPVIGVFGNVAFYIILMFIVMLFIKRDVGIKEWMSFIPALLALAFVIMAPQIIEQPRYAFPIIYIMPTLTAYYIASVKGSYKV